MINTFTAISHRLGTLGAPGEMPVDNRWRLLRV